jgi:hypothetical protein
LAKQACELVKGHLGFVCSIEKKPLEPLLEETERSTELTDRLSVLVQLVERRGVRCGRGAQHARRLAERPHQCSAPSPEHEGSSEDPFDGCEHRWFRETALSYGWRLMRQAGPGVVRRCRRVDIAAHPFVWRTARGVAAAGPGARRAMFERLQDRLDDDLMAEPAVALA